MIELSRAVATLAVSIALVIAPNTHAADKFQPGKVSGAEEKQLAEAKKLRQDKQYDEAIEILEALLKKNPDYYLATFYMALANAEKQRFREAMRWFQSAEKLQLKYQFKDPALFNSKGWAQLLAGEYDNAEQSFKKAELEFDFMNEDGRRKLLNNTGLLYMYKKDYDLAEKYLLRASNEYKSALAKENLATLNNLRKKAPAR